VGWHFQRDREEEMHKKTLMEASHMQEKTGAEKKRRLSSVARSNNQVKSAP
jgi:hypothetical protein